MGFNKTIFNFLLFALSIALLPMIAGYTGGQSLLVPKFWIIYFFITLLTFGAILFVLIIGNVNKDTYAPAFLGATTFKMLACLIFVLIFLRRNHPERVIFVCDFIYLYFLNTAFEVYALLSNLRNQNLK
jgi:hypothetical protein